MAIVIPSWLKAPDIASDFLRGVAEGGQLAAERARLNQQAVNAQMEASARAQVQQQENLREQARLATQKAYQDAQIGLEKQRLDEATMVNRQKLESAARKAMASQKLSSLLAQGVPIDQALLQTPELATPQNIMAANKQVQDLAGQRFELRKQEFAERQAEYERSQAQREKGKPVRIGSHSVKTIGKNNEQIEDTTDIYGIPGSPSLTAPPPAEKKRYRFDSSTGKLIPQ